MIIAHFTIISTNKYYKFLLMFEVRSEKKMKFLFNDWRNIVKINAEIVVFLKMYIFAPFIYHLIFYDYVYVGLGRL